MIYHASSEGIAQTATGEQLKVLSCFWLSSTIIYQISPLRQAHQTLWRPNQQSNVSSEGSTRSHPPSKLFLFKWHCQTCATTNSNEVVLMQKQHLDCELYSDWYSAICSLGKSHMPRLTRWERSKWRLCRWICTKRLGESTPQQVKKTTNMFHMICFACSWIFLHPTLAKRAQMKQIIYRESKGKNGRLRPTSVFAQKGVCTILWQWNTHTHIYIIIYK